MDIKQIEELMKLMKQYGVASLEIEEDEKKVSISMVPSGTGHSCPQAASLSEMTVPPAPGMTESVPAPSADASVLSPTVGVFYAAPSPEEPPFIQVGDHVEPETIVCIIESMKVMNEIPAGVRGTVTEILPVNGDRVDFEQKLVTVRADA